MMATAGVPPPAWLKAVGFNSSVRLEPRWRVYKVRRRRRSSNSTPKVPPLAPSATYFQRSTGLIGATALPETTADGIG